MSTTGPAGESKVPLRLSLGLGSGTMLQPLNSSMIAVAIIAIADQFGSIDGTAWIISGLYIATAVVSPAAGRLGVLFGPRRMYLAGLAIIAVGSVLGALAPTIGWLIAARVLQGIGTASQYPTAMMIIRNVVDRSAGNVRTALAVLTVCAQSMAAVGPTVGGLLTGVFGWQSIMWVNLPMVAITAVWVLRVAPADDGGAASAELGWAKVRDIVGKLDLPGTGLFLGLISTTMLFLLSLAGNPQWWVIPVVAALAALFWWREFRAADPFIDVRTIMSNRPLTMTLGRSMVTYTAFYLVFFGLPQWLQVGRGLSAGGAGAVMLPIFVISIGATFAASRMYGERGPRRTLFVGTAGLVLGGLLITTVIDQDVSIIVIVLIACVLGVPNSFNNMGNQNIVNAVTTKDQVGIGLGMYRTVQYIAANIAAVIIELAWADGINDDGLHRTGLVITGLGAALLLGVICSRSLRSQRVR